MRFILFLVINGRDGSAGADTLLLADLLEEIHTQSTVSGVLVERIHVNRSFGHLPLLMASRLGMVLCLIRGMGVVGRRGVVVIDRKSIVRIDNRERVAVNSVGAIVVDNRGKGARFSFSRGIPLILLIVAWAVRSLVVHRKGIRTPLIMVSVVSTNDWSMRWAMKWSWSMMVHSMLLRLAVI
jgi:hypothetical protein